MTKLEFLKGRTLITQNDVSFLLNDNKQIQIHYLINDEPNTIQCSLDFVKDACIKQLTLTNVGCSYSEKQVDDAYDKGFKDAMVKYRE